MKITLADKFKGNIKYLIVEERRGLDEINPNPPYTLKNYEITSSHSTHTHEFPEINKAKECLYKKGFELQFFTMPNLAGIFQTKSLKLYGLHKEFFNGKVRFWKPIEKRTNLNMKL